MILQHHTLHCRNRDQLFVAGFTTTGVDEAQRQDLAVYGLRTAVIDILSQLHAWGQSMDATTEWWCVTDLILDEEATLLALAHG